MTSRPRNGGVLGVVAFAAAVVIAVGGQRQQVWADNAAGWLLIESDPAGASVYVDGRLAGQTPVTVPAIAAGVHRVRFLRLGYLENSRLVTVKAGSRATLRARLTSPRPQTAGQAALRIVVLEGEGAVNIIQQKTAVAPVVEVRDRNDQPVAGAVVRFAIRSGRATFSGARTISVTTDAGGRAVAAGFAPTGTGGLQIGATAAFQGQTAAVTIAQTTVTTAAQAAAASSAAGAGAGGGSGLSATTLGVIAGAAAAGTVVGLKALAGGTTFRGDYSGQIVMTAGIAPTVVCTFVETVNGTVTITLDDVSSATGTARVTERSSVTGGNCGNQGNSANDDAEGPISGTPGSLRFDLQKTNPLSGGNNRIKPWSFIGQLNGSEITGVLTTGDINQTPGGVVDARGSSSIPITLR
jgi:PEGA domain